MQLDIELARGKGSSSTVIAIVYYPSGMESPTLHGI